MSTWLMKSEPSEYSIDRLEQEKCSSWFGVRNYQARNFMRDQMQVGDVVLFYHSSCKEVGIAGIARVASLAHPDESQFEVGKYFEPKATREKPIWYCIDVAFERKLQKIYTIGDIRATPGLETMKILEKGNRLSITPVTETEYQILLSYLDTE